VAVAELSNQVAIITGASRGIGRAAALALADAGLATVLVARDRDDLRTVAAYIGNRGGGSLVIPGDVRRERHVQYVVEQTIHTLGRVDALVNVAGVGVYGRTRDFSVEHYDKIIDTNLTGVFLFCREVVPIMREQGGGAIITVSAGAGLHAQKRAAVYSASKFGVRGFMRALAAEVADSGIRCCTVFPGYVETTFAGAKPPAEPSPGYKALVPEDVAGAIAYMLTCPPHAWVQELSLWPLARGK
jgi:NAD(P)-dependent dehydrogenase (short-subunit alcohol dehydrogenase family)